LAGIGFPAFFSSMAFAIRIASSKVFLGNVQGFLAASSFGVVFLLGRFTVGLPSTEESAIFHHPWERTLTRKSKMETDLSI
jgi:hypothetical protein